LCACRKLLSLALAGFLVCACTEYVGLHAGGYEKPAATDGGSADGEGDFGADPAPDGGASDAGPCGLSVCEQDSQCPPEEVCVAGRCGPVSWAPEADCDVAASGCAAGRFPDDCYQNGVFVRCPTRGEPVVVPACASFLELGAPGPGDDQRVVRLLYDLWKEGQRGSQPPRPRVVMALGDSISASPGYLNARAFECSLPDFPFAEGYRLVGQPDTWDTVLSALGSTTAEWGRSLVEDQDWYRQIRPEMATVMFGTNELWYGSEGLQQYVADLRAIVDGLLERRVIPILVTLPPGTYPVFGSREICGEWCPDLEVNYRTEDFAQAVRDLAAERLLPLVDLHLRYREYDKGSWVDLLSDGVHPCHQGCSAGVEHTGCEIRDDAVLRMIKFLEARALDRCPGSGPPPRPDGYRWNDADVLSNFRGAAPKSYCPDPVVICR
jgi:lysophospholipase L1-like esterase